ncbi:MAG: ferrous iron transport protein B [Thermoleophilia bacterium]|nr:ferrous iron transport protein B [Thermoleophilia bacterium]
MNKLHGETDFTIALAGNPNVGKSSIFNSLTGMGVETANYPGKTVELNIATTTLDGLNIGIIDLPGTYALGAVSDDQWVARQGVLDGEPDAVVMVVDATNMTRNLYMVLQFLELGYPMVVAMNVMDAARREGRHIDLNRLSVLLGVPVVPTVANRGEGLDEMIMAAVEVARTGQKPTPLGISYGLDVESMISQVSEAISGAGLEEPYGIPDRALSLLLLEKDPEFLEITSALPGWAPVLELAASLRKKIEIGHGQKAATRIAGERHALAGLISDEVESMAEEQELGWGERLWRYTTSPATGIPILLFVLAANFLILYIVGNGLAEVISNFWATYVAAPLKDVVFSALGENIVTISLLWAVDGFQAALTVGIPFVLVFYILFAFLEDTGYLNSVAFLTDSVMHRFGLHGRAMIPIVAGAGCNVPAIIGTRVLTTMRERVMAGVLIVMVPCSARNAVIFGAVAFYAGWQSTLALYTIILFLWVAVGLALNRMMPGEATGLVMEMFPFRRPHLKTIYKKTWNRFKDFVFMAIPLLIAGSIVLGLLFQWGVLQTVAGWFSPVIEGWMGLPAAAGVALMIAVLRKELALQLLVTLAIAAGAGEAARDNLNAYMTNEQLFIFALVAAIYIPCIATIAALARELGWKRAMIIMSFTIGLAVLVGGLVNQYFKLT